MISIALRQVLLILCLARATEVSTNAGPQDAWGVSEVERQALIALYEATGGPRWKHRVGWLGAPGTECEWHGVECGIHGRHLVTDIAVSGLELFDNNLAGSVPDAIVGLAHLERLNVSGNPLTGKLPAVLARRWADGSLDVSAPASLLTDVSEIDFESGATAILCARHRIVFRADGRATMYTERCRQSTPQDRTTFCEVKSGSISSDEFARLGVLFERSGFFGLQPDYSRSITDAGQETTRVTRGDTTYRVSNYATAGPMALWSLQRALEGTAASVEWQRTTKQRECPRQPEAP